MVVRRFGDFDAAEDAVQEALLAAALHWPAEGMPDNPRGWLIQTAVAADDRPAPQRARPGAAARTLAALARAAGRGRHRHATTR